MARKLELISQNEFAKIVGCSDGTLCIWRQQGKHNLPEPVAERGNAGVLYDKAEAIRWAEDFKIKRLGFSTKDLEDTYIRASRLAEQLGVDRGSIRRWELTQGFPSALRVGGKPFGKHGQAKIGTISLYPLRKVEDWIKANRK